MTKIRLPNIVKKQPVALGCALLCVGLAVAIYLRRGTLAEAQTELEDKTSQGKHFKENVDNANSANKADRLEEQYAAMTQATQAIEARLVHADQLAINLQYFYKIESETHTKLTDLRQTGVETANARNGAKTTYVGVGYALSVQGTYAQLLSFLRSIENGERFSRVMTLTLSRAGGDENSPGETGSLLLNLDLELLGLP
jgi:hypothetical protein